MSLRHVLLITYHFPPSAASGTFRMLGFARHLRRFDWQPLVVAPPRLPLEPVDPNLLAQVPVDTPVYRVPYPEGVASRPLRRLIRHGVWVPRALGTCLEVVRRHRPDAVVTSGPPHYVHLLGLVLKLWRQLPWVADFRDPWLTGAGQHRAFVATHWETYLERAVIRGADGIVANAPRAGEAFRAAYPLEAPKFFTITNGYDPEVFPAPRAHDPGAPFLHLLHTGELYAGRDPRPLLDALQELQREGYFQRRPLRITFLGRDNDAGCDLGTAIEERGLGAVVQRGGQVPYRRALEEMVNADVLLLLDSPGRRSGVPAKLYEYLGAARPVLALAEEDGDLAAILRQSGVAHRLAAPTNPPAIKLALVELVEDLAGGRAVPPTADQLFRFTREHMAQSLAELLDRVAGRPARRKTRAPAPAPPPPPPPGTAVAPLVSPAPSQAHR
jgi:glycosyltransferase involved in cell wall biosynthesis